MLWPIGVCPYLSEVDVNDAVFPDDIAERDEAVAQMYRDYLAPLLRHRSVKRLVFWGLCDRDHWIVRETAEEGRIAGLGRPALFDNHGKPKAAFFAVADALESAPAR